MLGIDHDEITFYKGKDHEGREHAESYAQWLEKELGLKPVKDPKALVAAAQKKHKAAFDAWMAKFTR